MASLALELDHHRTLCKRFIEDIGPREMEDNMYTASEPFQAWFQRSERYATELGYLEELLDVSGARSRERHVIRLRYYEGLEWWQVAKAMHYSEAHVRRFHEVTIQKMEEAQRWEQMDIEDVAGA